MSDLSYSETWTIFGCVRQARQKLLSMSQIEWLLEKRERCEYFLRVMRG